MRRLVDIAEAFRSILARFRAQDKINRKVEIRLTSLEEQYASEIGPLLGIVIAEHASLTAGLAEKNAALAAALTALEQERADRDATVTSQVKSALDADSTADAERLRIYLDQLRTAVPVQVPEVPVPDPGVPAEVPPDSGVEVPQVPATEQP